MGLLATLTGMAVPAVTAGVDDFRTAAAARYMSSRLALARFEAVRRARSVGIRFEPDPDGHRFAFYVDGNANGVRTGEIRAGVDEQWLPPMRLAEQFARVRFAIGRDVPAIDDEGTALAAGSDPLRFGRADILTFTPLGTATSGTLYLEGPGGQQYALRILGGTGRTRLLRYDAVQRRWMEQ
jgi:hypothetical protein